MPLRTAAESRACVLIAVCAFIALSTSLGPEPRVATTVVARDNLDHFTLDPIEQTIRKPSHQRVPQVRNQHTEPEWVLTDPRQRLLDRRAKLAAEARPLRFVPVARILQVLDTFAAQLELQLRRPQITRCASSHDI